MPVVAGGGVGSLSRAKEAWLMRHALSQSHLLLDFNFNLGFFCVVNLKSFYRLDFFVFIFVSKRLKLWVVDKFFVVVWAI